MISQTNLTEVVCQVLKVDNIVVNGVFREVWGSNSSRIVIDLRPSDEVINTCPFCGNVCDYYDTPRRYLDFKHWRSLDWGNEIVVLRYKPHRVLCPDHGVVVAAVPWAYHDCSFTKEFDKQVTCMATKMSKSAISQLMRMTWDAVGRCITRVRNDIEPNLSERLNGLVQIGIDENAYGKGHQKFVMIVVNHLTNEVVWIKEGRSKEVISTFFEELNEEQKKSIKLVSADGAEWIHDVVHQYCPDAQICLDPFHLFEWVTKAENDVRIKTWQDIQRDIRDLREQKDDIEEELKDSNNKDARSCVKNIEAVIENLQEIASNIKSSQYLFLTNSENLTPEEKLKQDILLSMSKVLQRVHGRIESLKSIMKSDCFEAAKVELKKWIRWTKVSRLEPFKKLGKTMERFFDITLNTIKYGLSNARVEANNTKIKSLVRRSYGFRSVENLKDMVYLCCSTRYLQLPNRGLEPKGTPRWRFTRPKNFLAVS